MISIFLSPNEFLKASTAAELLLAAAEAVGAGDIPRCIEPRCTQGEKIAQLAADGDSNQTVAKIRTIEANQTTVHVLPAFFWLYNYFHISKRSV